MLFKHFFQASALIALVSLTACKEANYTMLDLEAVNSTNANIEVSFRIADAVTGDAPSKKFDLSKSLQVLEDGQLMSAKEGNNSSINTPRNFNVDILLVIDLSGSVANAKNLDKIQEAAKSFVTQTLAKNINGREMRISIKSFDGSDSLTNIVDFTKDTQKLMNSLSSLTPGEDPSTNLYGALVESYKFMSAHSVPGDLSKSLKKKAIVFFTDGKDQAARVSKDDALSAIQSARYEFGDLFYAVAVGEELTQDVLSQFGAKDSGYFIIDRGFKKLTEAFKTISNKLHSYADSYYVARICSPKRKGIHYISLKVGESVSKNIEFNANGFKTGCNVDSTKQWENKAADSVVTWGSALLTDTEKNNGAAFYKNFVSRDGYVTFKIAAENSATGGWISNYSPFESHQVACHLYMPANSPNIAAGDTIKIVDYRSYNGVYSNAPTSTSPKFVGVQLSLKTENNHAYFLQCRTLEALSTELDLASLSIDFK